MITFQKLQWSMWWLHHWMFTRLQCFKEYYKLVSTDLRAQQKLNANPNSVLQINFTGNLDWNGNTKMLFINKEAK